MLKITIPAREWWDENKQEFIYTKEKVLQLEHSLISISKWESKWEKPFLDPRPDSPPKTREETLDYIRCMTLNQNVDRDIYRELTNDNIKEVNEYINAKMTATWFSNGDPLKKTSSGRMSVITSEVIYAWMVQYGIPAEYQKWHLNHLLTLIRVLNDFNTEPKKMSKGELMRRNASLNAIRRKQLNTKG